MADETTSPSPSGTGEIEMNPVWARDELPPDPAAGERAALAERRNALRTQVNEKLQQSRSEVTQADAQATIEERSAKAALDAATGELGEANEIRDVWAARVTELEEATSPTADGDIDAKAELLEELGQARAVLAAEQSRVQSMEAEVAKRAAAHEVATTAQNAAADRSVLHDLPFDRAEEELDAMDRRIHLLGDAEAGREAAAEALASALEAEAAGDAEGGTAAREIAAAHLAAADRALDEARSIAIDETVFSEIGLDPGAIGTPTTEPEHTEPEHTEPEHIEMDPEFVGRPGGEAEHIEMDPEFVGSAASDVRQEAAALRTRLLERVQIDRAAHQRQADEAEAAYRAAEAEHRFAKDAHESVNERLSELESTRADLEQELAAAQAAGSSEQELVELRENVDLAAASIAAQYDVVEHSTARLAAATAKLETATAPHEAARKANDELGSALRAAEAEIDKMETKAQLQTQENQHIAQAEELTERAAAAAARGDDAVAATLRQQAVTQLDAANKVSAALAQVEYDTRVLVDAGLIEPEEATDVDVTRPPDAASSAVIDEMFDGAILPSDSALELGDEVLVGFEASGEIDVSTDAADAEFDPLLPEETQDQETAYEAVPFEETQFEETQFEAAQFDTLAIEAPAFDPIGQAADFGAVDETAPVDDATVDFAEADYGDAG